MNLIKTITTQTLNSAKKAPGFLAKSVKNGVSYTVESLKSLSSYTKDTVIPRVYKIGTSIVGQKAIDGLKENTLEFAGWMIGSYAAMPIEGAVGEKFGALGKTLGKTLAVALSLFGSKAVAQILDTQSDRSTSANRRTLAFAKNFLVSWFVLHTFLFDPLSELGKDLGVNLGEYITSTGISMLCAYIAIKFAGSEEVLYGVPVAETYGFKTMQSIWTGDVLNYLNLTPSTLGIKQITDLVIGSLSFNFLYLKELATKSIEGQLLNDAPKVGQVISVEELTQSSVTSLTRQAIDSGSTRLTKKFLSNLVKESLSNHENAALVLNHIINNHDLLNANLSLTNLIKEAFFNYSDIEQQVAEKIVSQIDLERLSQSTLNLIVRSFNLASQPENEVNPGDLLARLSSAEVAKVSNQIVSYFKELEEKVFGFPLVGKRTELSTSEFLQQRIKNIVAAGASYLSKHGTELGNSLTKEEIRQFYSNLNQFVAGYYSTGLNQTLYGAEQVVIKIGKQFANHQIQNSKLAD